MSQTVAHLVDHVVPHVPVRQWVLWPPIPLRVLLAAQPELVTLVLQVVQRVVTRHLLDHAGLKSGLPEFDTLAPFSAISERAPHKNQRFSCVFLVLHVV
jgi:hypothetical protein